MIRISIIIPVYNTEQYLNACIDSVLRQDMDGLEVICVDDASTDGSPRILDAYARSDERVRVVHLKENRKQGHARNLGLEMAAGKYVYFLDSDDEIIPDTLKELWDLAEADALDGIFFDSRAVYEGEDLMRRNSSYAAARTGLYPQNVLTGTKLFTLFIEQHEWLVYVQRQFWNRQFLIRNGILFEEDNIHEDELFSMKAVLSAGRVRYVKKNYVNRRFRTGSITMRITARDDLHGYFLSYCRVYAQIPSDRMLPAAEINAAHLYELAVRNYRRLPKEEQRINLFKGTALEKEYGFFMCGLNSRDVWEDTLRKDFEPLYAFRSVMIYGAGKAASLAYMRMRQAGLNISGFLVSSPDRNPEELYGRPVIPIAAYDPDEEEIIVAAMAKEHIVDVRETLRGRHLPFYHYTGSVLRGPFLSGERSTEENET